jgi:hypothetical protein
MLISKEVEVGLNSINIKHYENLGYIIPRYEDSRHNIVVKRGTKILVKVEDLTNVSNVGIQVECDECNKILNITWGDYLKCVKEDGKYYCNKCALKLYTSENMRVTKLKNSKSFKEWCIKNNRQDILNRWDYELNKHNPDEISYGTHKTFYFKCPANIHKSELKNINSFTSGCEGSISCNHCNSFAQFGINSLGEDFIYKYWNYEKNNELGINPWEISKSCNTKVWIKCQEKDYHGSYYVWCNDFLNGVRCPDCQYSKGEERINNYLILNKISHESQKTFDTLVGMSNGLLSYDFYLPEYNLLIEYQGEFHDGNGNYYMKQNLEKQQEHDRRKKEYAQLNNIKLLEIWYYEFDQIEDILYEYLEQFKYVIQEKEVI